MKLDTPLIRDPDNGVPRGIRVDRVWNRGGDMKKTDQMRRSVLKGIAVTVCYCGAPQLLIAQEASKEAKVPKEQAKYQSSPNGEMRCGNCMHFLADTSTCRLVEGPVEESGYCTLWGSATK
jgi:hypothetical protein